MRPVSVANQGDLTLTPPSRYCEIFDASPLYVREAEITLEAYNNPIDLVIVSRLKAAQQSGDRTGPKGLPGKRIEVSGTKRLLRAPAGAEVPPQIEPAPRGGHHHRHRRFIGGHRRQIGGSGRPSDGDGDGNTS